MTTTTTTTSDVSASETAPTFYVDVKHEGFAFDPDEAIGFAVADLLVIEAGNFDRELAAARALAAADEASPLSRPKRAEFAAALMVDHPTRDGYVLTMTSTTYSKRCKAGRATDDQVLEFLMVCDTPSLDKLYEWLPKQATGRPKGSKTTPKTAPEPAPEPEVSEPETAPTVTDADIPKIAADVLAGLTTRGLTRAQVSLLISELDRLTTPVRSVA